MAVMPAEQPTALKLPPPPAPTLDALPPDVLRTVAARLSLSAISSLGCSCAEVARTLASFDDLFARRLGEHVHRLLRGPRQARR